MKPIKWILLVAFVGLIFSQVAAAETTDPQEINFPWMITDWPPQTGCVDKFDPSLGILDGVTLTIESCTDQQWAVDSEDSSDQDFRVTSSAQTTSTLPNPLPGGESLILSIAPQDITQRLSADTDVAPDWTGTDARIFYRMRRDYHLYSEGPR